MVEAMKLISTAGKGWRTVTFNLVVGLAGWTDWLAGGELVRAVIKDPEDVALALTVIGAINIVLRRMTSTPLGSKE